MGFDRITKFASSFPRKRESSGFWAPRSPPARDKLHGGDDRRAPTQGPSRANTPRIRRFRGGGKVGPILVCAPQPSCPRKRAPRTLSSWFPALRFASAGMTDGREIQAAMLVPSFPCPREIEREPRRVAC